MKIFTYCIGLIIELWVKIVGMTALISHLAAIFKIIRFSQ